MHGYVGNKDALLASAASRRTGARTCGWSKTTPTIDVLTGVRHDQSPKRSLSRY